MLTPTTTPKNARKTIISRAVSVIINPFFFSYYFLFGQLKLPDIITFLSSVAIIFKSGNQPFFMDAVIDYSVLNLVPVEIEPFGCIGFERDGFFVSVGIGNFGCLRLIRIVNHNVFTGLRIAGDFNFNIG